MKLVFAERPDKPGETHLTGYYLKGIYYKLRKQGTKERRKRWMGQINKLKRSTTNMRNKIKQLKNDDANKIEIINLEQFITAHDLDISRLRELLDAKTNPKEHLDHIKLMMEKGIVKDDYEGE